MNQKEKILTPSEKNAEEKLEKQSNRNNMFRKTQWILCPLVPFFRKQTPGNF